MAPYTRRYPGSAAARTPLSSGRQSGLVLPAVVPAEPGEAAMLARLIGHSFRYLDPSAALVPDMRSRVAVMSAYFEIWVRHAMTHGRVNVLADRTAVAVLFDHTKPVPEPDDYDQRRAAAGGQWTENLVHLDALFEQHHPRYPHHQLLLFAVAEDERGTGRGGKLLAHCVAEFDKAGIRGYLEAASWPLTGLYEAYGFRSDQPFHMANNGPAFWPMQRAPQPTT